MAFKVAWMSMPERRPIKEEACSNLNKALETAAFVTLKRTSPVEITVTDEQGKVYLSRIVGAF